MTPNTYYLGYQRCRTTNCEAFTLGEYCDRCREEVEGTPYNLAQVLTNGRVATWGEAGKLLMAGAGLFAGALIFAWLVLV